MVPYSADEMYALVIDIPKYPQFLPWCNKAHIHDVSTVDDQSVTATVGINFKGLKKSFTTRNQNVAGELVEMRLVDGIFKHLHGVWEFKPLSIDNERAACHVALSMEFDFAGSLINRVVAPVFTRIADTMLDAFIQRAESVYGKRQLA